MKKIINFIIKHPFWTAMILWIILIAIIGKQNGNYNPAGALIITAFIAIIVAPFIRNARKKKEKKEDMDYFAKKIAEEQNKNK